MSSLQAASSRGRLPSAPPRVRSEWWECAWRQMKARWIKQSIEQSQICPGRDKAEAGGGGRGRRTRTTTAANSLPSQPPQRLQLRSGCLTVRLRWREVPTEPRTLLLEPAAWSPTARQLPAPPPRGLASLHQAYALPPSFQRALKLRVSPSRSSTSHLLPPTLPRSPLLDASRA